MIGFLEGALMHGIFHGDLHAGNLFVLPNGKIALMDFGITGRMTEPKRLALLSMLVGASNNDVPAQVAAMRDLGALPDDIDVEHVIAQLGLDRPPIDPTQLSPEELVGEMQRSVKALLALGARLPKELMLFVKNMVFLDGAIASLAPDIDLFSEIESIALNVRPEARGADRGSARPGRRRGLGSRHERDQGGFRPGRVDADPHAPRAPGPPDAGAREVRRPRFPPATDAASTALRASRDR